MTTHQIRCDARNSYMSLPMLMAMAIPVSNKMSRILLIDIRWCSRSTPRCLDFNQPQRHWSRHHHRNMLCNIDVLGRTRRNYSW